MDRKAGTGSIKTVESTFKKQELGLSPSRRPIAAQEKPSLLGFPNPKVTNGFFHSVKKQEVGEKTVGCREIVGGGRKSRLSFNDGRRKRWTMDEHEICSSASRDTSSMKILHQAISDGTTIKTSLNRCRPFDPRASRCCSVLELSLRKEVSLLPIAAKKILRLA
ncbi:unnamed protein product, partial [Musa acuminata var. zebrina]